MIRKLSSICDSPKKCFLLFVKIATVAVFTGRAWQHLYWDAPYRALFWDESWMRPLIEGVFQTPWLTYVTNPATDAAINNLVIGTGWFYLVCAVLAIWIEKLGRAGRWLMRLGGLSLIFLGLLYLKEKFFFLGQFFEYTLQWSSPFLLAYLAKGGTINKRVVLVVKIAIALTFTCHGLYAVGYYPRPGHFTEMVMNITHLSEANAVTFLIVVGILDFVLSIGIFVPGRIALISLAYATFWGFGTTIARVWAHFYPQFWESILYQWLHESVMRFPHFLIPLALFIWLWKTTPISLKR